MMLFIILIELKNKFISPPLIDAKTAFKKCNTEIKLSTFTITDLKLPTPNDCKSKTKYVKNLFAVLESNQRKEMLSSYLVQRSP